MNELHSLKTVKPISPASEAGLGHSAVFPQPPGPGWGEREREREQRHESSTSPRRKLTELKSRKYAHEERESRWSPPRLEIMKP